MNLGIGDVLVQLLNGLSYSSFLFLVAAGLSVIFGVTRIINLAHGSFYMLGAYLAVSLTTLFPATIVGFWGGIVCAALVIGLVGVLVETLVLRRIYEAPELVQLLATFGILLVIQNVTLKIWGTEELFAPRAPGLTGSLRVFGRSFPEYHLVLILIGPVVLGLLWLLSYRTRWGVLIRAATQDRDMVGALGVNERMLFQVVFFLGTMLAAFAGALRIPVDTINLQMDLSVLTETFVVVVVGGMGSVLGAYLAALVIGLLHAFGIMIFPKITLVLMSLVMAIVLVFRPYGLLGKREGAARKGILAIELPIKPGSLSFNVFWLGVLVVLLVAPMVVGSYFQTVLIEVLILALYAASLHFVLSIGGLSSLGHAAYFGLGAYAVALATSLLGMPTLTSLTIAAFAALVAAAIFGWFCIRLSGIYLAMLTLAFAQIMWSIALQWVDLTGGDNGILGLYRSPALASITAYYYLVLSICVVAVLVMRHLVFAPFGYALRAARDSALRTEALGIDAHLHRWVALVISGGFGGLAGGLQALQKGGAFPDGLSVSQSIDALVVILIGGLQTLVGPIVGAAAYFGVKTEIMRYLGDSWQLVLGLTIILLAVLFPQGIAGFIKQRAER
jgi:branched-chain amino acid transport system permease protein